MGDTKIEWTDKTWNPIRGCSRVSSGCTRCYAEGVARRFSGPGLAYEGLVRIGGDGKPHEWNGNIKFVAKHLLDPLKWKEPKRIFVNSMSDLFHENVTIEWLESILQVVSDCPQHTFQVLTKRPARMQKLMSMLGAFHAGERVAVCIGGGETPGAPYVLSNLHLGVSCEDQATADERIPLLLQTPAAAHFISAEPLLAPLNLHPWLCRNGDLGRPEQRYSFICDPAGRLAWVIVGGESGRGARPMHPDWARDLRDQCQAAGVPFFFKQNGEYVSVSEVAGSGAHHHFEDGTTVRRVGKKAAGAMLDGRQWREFPKEKQC